MHYRMLFAAAVLFISACKDSKEAPGATGTIPQPTLEKILYDMQLAEVYSLSVRADTSQNYGIKNQDSLARYYNEIFKRHGVSYEQFKKTIDWYKEQPASFDSVYQNVLTRLSVEEEKLKYLKK